jgi:hypothetical protein
MRKDLKAVQGDVAKQKIVADIVEPVEEIIPPAQGSPPTLSFGWHFLKSEEGLRRRDRQGAANGLGRHLVGCVRHRKILAHAIGRFCDAAGGWRRS